MEENTGPAAAEAFRANMYNIHNTVKRKRKRKKCRRNELSVGHKAQVILLCFVQGARFQVKNERMINPDGLKQSKWPTGLFFSYLSSMTITILATYFWPLLSCKNE